MKLGERQVAPTVDGIRRDHVARYEFAAQVLPQSSRVIDFACGVGYGTRILSDAGHTACGYDRDREALAYAADHYSGPKTDFKIGDGGAPGGLGEYDAAVCFETIEHVKDPRPLLRALRTSAPRLIASVPNEAVMPWRRADGATTAFHFRHYTRDQFQALLGECGWHVVQWYGQAGPESEVELNVSGRTLIGVAEHCEPNEVTLKPEDPDIPPRHVAILGLGGSVDQYLDIVKRLGGRSKFCDEVWTINALGDVFDCDLVFHMDDIRIQEIRAKAAPDTNIAAMIPWIKASKVPIVTSRAHPDYPALVEFPLEDVLNNLGHDYFNSTAAYAVAFAIHVGVEKLSLFGMDFTYANSHHAEKGRGCVEFWLGFARARGINLSMPTSTTLMDACHTQAERFYGYDTLDLKLDVQPDGTVKVAMTPRDTLPTAEQIEKWYDHSLPIAEQHLKKETA